MLGKGPFALAEVRFRVGCAGLSGIPFFLGVEVRCVGETTGLGPRRLGFLPDTTPPLVGFKIEGRGGVAVDLMSWAERPRFCQGLLFPEGPGCSPRGSGGSGSAEEAKGGSGGPLGSRLSGLCCRSSSCSGPGFSRKKPLSLPVRVPEAGRVRRRAAEEHVLVFL